MGLFRKKEVRAAEVEIEDPLLKALLNGGEVTREMALQIPTVSGGIDLVANIISGTPIKLYRDEGGKAVEIRDDPRLRLLNDETGDTLNANEFWKAIIRDYYLGCGGYAYIHRERGKIKSLHYVEESQISIQKNTDPIFKDFDIIVQGRIYHSFEFLKILRNTKDGAQGTPVIVENSKIIEAAYAAIVFERNLVKRGGNKKGFLKSEKRLDQSALDSLKAAFARLYGNDSDASENFVMLNSGIDFKESSNTSVEMQLNENKVTNAEEFAKIFHVQTAAISGSANESDISSLARLAAIPLMITIQCALNKDLLLEKEKGSYYYAFDTKELLRGDMASRFSAYKTALDANFMQIDEVRYAEDMEPLGLTWIKLGLQDVLYDPQTRTVFTPNTGNQQMLDKAPEESENAGLTVSNADHGPALSEPCEDDIIEPRANPNHDPRNGRFTSGGKGGGKRKTKYAPSTRTNHSKIKTGPKKYAKLCGAFRTKYPDAKQSDGLLSFSDGVYIYKAIAAENGGINIESRRKIK